MKTKDYGFLKSLPLDPIEILEYHAHHNPKRAAVLSPGRSYNYFSLVETIDRIAIGLLEAGISQRNTIAISFANHVNGFLVSLALNRIGCACCLVLVNSQEPISGVDGFITDTDQNLPWTKKIIFNPNWIDGASVSTAKWKAERGFKSREDIAIITQTSGTTAKAKIIGSSLAKIHNAVLGNLLHPDHPADATPCLVNVGLGSLWGYRQMLTILWSGGTLVFGNTHVSTAQAFRPLGVKHIVAPINRLSQWVKIAEQSPNYFSTIEFVTTAGGMLTSTLVDGVHQHLCKKIYMNYGASETGLIAAGSTDIRANYPSAVGKVLSSVKVEIIDENNQALPYNTNGKVRVKVGNQKDPFGGSNFVDGWFYPGDEGLLTEDGILSILGRQDGVTNFGGVKLQLELAEEKLTGYSGVSDAAYMAVKNEHGVPELICVYVPNEKFEIEKFSKCFPELILLKSLFAVNIIPRGENGKVQRQKLEESYLANLAKGDLKK